VNTTPESAYDLEASLDPTVPETVAESPAVTQQVNPDNPPWGIGGALLGWAITILAMFIVPNICVLPYLAYKYRGTPVTWETLMSDTTYVFLMVLGFLPTHLITLAIVWAIATGFGKRSIRKVFGWSWSPGFGMWKSVGLAFALFLVTIFLLTLFGGPKTDLDRILESSRATAIVLAVIAVATAPLAEEMVYRGLLYSAFQRVIGTWLAIAVVSAMFAALHVIQYWPNDGAITSISLLSFALTLIRARTGRLLPCFVVHLVFNGIQSVIILLEPYLRMIFELLRQQPANPTPALFGGLF
jgi:membrane protease YdiL (CAAX protease family)